MLLELQRLVEHSDPIQEKTEIKYILPYVVECFLQENQFEILSFWGLFKSSHAGQTLPVTQKKTQTYSQMNQSACVFTVFHACKFYRPTKNVSMLVAANSKQYVVTATKKNYP